MEAVYPAVSAARGRRMRRTGVGARLRRHTMPVTFAEIKEVDEEMEEAAKVTSESVPRPPSSDTPRAPLAPLADT